MDMSNGNRPGATLSLNLPHSDMPLYSPSDYSSPRLNGEVPCNGLPGKLHHVRPQDEHLRVHCNGTAAAPSPTTGSTGEQEEKTSESEPDRSHSSHSEAAPADFDMETLPEPEETSPIFGEAVRGRIVCNVDGVVGFLSCDDNVFKVWPRFSSSVVIDQSSSETVVPSTFFPFHTVAHVPSSGSGVSFYECELPSSSSPHASQALDLYQNLPLPFPVQESHSLVPLYVCLLCPPIHFDSETTFLHHVSTKHDLPFVRNFSESFGAIAQRDGPNGEPVCSWLKPISTHAPDFPLYESCTPTNQSTAKERFTPEPDTSGAQTEPKEQAFSGTMPNREDDLPEIPPSTSWDMLPLDLPTSLSVLQSEEPENLEVKRKPEEPLVRPTVLSFRGLEQSEEADDNSLDSSSVHSYDPEDLTLPYRPEEHNHGHTHEHGKSSSVECPKCDIVLGSSKSLGGHMTMVHSRNSSKTLKCPKCNWHYKYQETLEIHMKEKHPESEETCPYCLTGQSHPRLARGEVYSCGYKPYRCDICNYSTTSKGNLTIHMQSDKHVNNVQDRQKTGGGEVAATSAEGLSPVEEMPPQTIARSSSNSSNRGPFRCEMCNYETNVSRNLRIHMTSDKHQQNAAMVLGQNRRAEMASMMTPSNGMGMFDATTMMQLMGMNAADMMSMQQAYMSSLTNGGPSTATAPPSVSADQKPVARSAPHIPRIPEDAKVLQCLVCVHHQTDSFEGLRDHVSRDRSEAALDSSESLIMNGPQCICKYCQYKTNLKANFQLHCKTDKHLQRMQLVNHVAEGGTDKEWRLQYLNTSNPVQKQSLILPIRRPANKIYITVIWSGARFQPIAVEMCATYDNDLVRCNACDYQTTSVTQMRIHLESNESHEVNRAVLFRVRDLQLEVASTAALPNINKSPPHLLNASSALIPRSSTRKWKLCCSCCVFASKSSASFMQHMRSALHYRNARTVNTDQVSSSTNAHPDHTAFISIKEEDSDNENGVDSDVEDFLDEREQALPEAQEEQPERSSRSHPVFMCPLCQEPSYSRDRLKLHLTGKHKVDAGEALSKLMRLVETSDAWTERAVSREPSPSSTTSEAEGDKALHLSDASHNNNSDVSDVYRCQKCSEYFKNIEQLYAHQNEKCHLELKQTPRGPGYLCWKKGCNQYFKSKQSLQMHFTEIHARKAQAGMAQHSENAHDSDGASTPHTDENSQNGDGEMDDELNSASLAESGYRDVARKYKCHRCKVAFTNQNYLTAHNKTPQHRKGEKSNYSMEKYMDPNRPYKCEVCRESFTQKNILLVHYNSVSHLHKLKKYRNMQDRKFGNFEPDKESPPQVPKRPSSNSLEDDAKPYRCKVCKVAYANASNLDIHVRSVAHQSRMAKASCVTILPSSNAVDLSQSVQREQGSPERMEEDEEVTSLPPVANLEEKETVIQRAPTTGAVSPTLARRTFGRGRGNVGWMSMMENIGLEVVQHGLENGQKPVKKSKDTTLEPVEGENSTPDKASLKNECQVCHKQFSSQWILKVHKESSHGDFIPSKILEAVASEYRKTIRADKPKQKRPLETEPTSKVTEKESPKKLRESQQANITSSSPQPSTSSSTNANNYAADLMAAQAMQLLPLLYPGLGMAGMNMMGLQAAMMNLQPQLMSNNGQYLEALGLPDMSKGGSGQASVKNFQLGQNGEKRNRTRITEEQQAILRANFDIKSSPSDELLQCLCEQTGLELKVVKHWYRNTLFKERQRNKDSPYNFNVPPNPNSTVEESTTEERPSVIESVVQVEPRREVREEKIRIPVIVKREKSVDSVMEEPSSRSMRDSSVNQMAMSTPSPTPGYSGPLSTSGSIGQQLQMGEDRGGGKRANRTRFTELQIKALQDYFDRNAYPKDDDLEDLSRALDLQPRVITVWFQNARQKARKSYENTTPPEEEAPVIRTPSLNYQCKKCLQVFQKYYELIRHQRVQCSGTSAGLNMKDMDDACSVASASSVTSSKLGSVKAERDLGLSNGGGSAYPNTVPVASVLAASPFMFSGLYPANSPFGMLQMEAISNPMAGTSQSAGSSPLPLASSKRKVSSDDENDGGESGNKRVRTTIAPEQLDFLLQQYKIDQNPSRKTLEHVASRTGLKKRVVQVWYQNTRARDRKGALNVKQVNKRCPVCRLKFAARNTLEAHISTKHADIYCKGDVNVDNLPDTDGGDSADDRSMARSTPSPVPLPPKVSLPSTSASALQIAESMQRFYYEETMKKYMAGAEIVPSKTSTQSSHPTSVIVKAASKPSASTDAPLDLSAPTSSSKPSTSASVTAASLAMLGAFNNHDDSYGGDQEGSDEEDGSNMRGGDGSVSQSGRQGKRYRTQMSNAQLKVMKRLFDDYKTPSMVECEIVGEAIGLPKRVVQVWFQNARAKDKKNPRPAGFDGSKPPITDHCPMCNVTFSAKLTLQDHLFTREHIGQLKKSEDCHDGPSTSSMMARLTSPAPKTEREPARQSVVVANHTKKSPAEGDRKHVSEVSQSASKKSQNVKNEASEQLARNQQSMQQMQQAAVAQAAMSSFGDLSAMMMSGAVDPMMAYMCAMNPYYNPAAMMNPYAGMMYMGDPTVHGTALHNLQLPPGVAEQIFSKLSSNERSANSSAVAFAQDGKRLSDLREVVSASDFACATSSQSDIGSVCRKCQTVFPTEANCKAHQNSMCFPGSKDPKNILKLQQIHFHCTVCQKQLPTITDFKQHCSTPLHQKNRQSHATPSLKKSSSGAHLEEKRNR